MIVWKTGDLFTSQCNCWINTVNCEGVMGKGIALQFKKRFPEMFDWYAKECKDGNFKNGGDWRIWTNSSMFPPINIICVATKESWRNPSKIEWIEKFLNEFSEYDWLPNASFAFPKLGCANGKLDWITQVKPLMIKHLEPMLNKIEIYV